MDFYSFYISRRKNIKDMEFFIFHSMLEYIFDCHEKLKIYIIFHLKTLIQNFIYVEGKEFVYFKDRAMCYFFVVNHVERMLENYIGILIVLRFEQLC